ncbi:MAG: hypothetical protein ACYSR6_11905 [Planctomycetota bacterium]|jgi:DnaJ-class molecular chaperone
MMDNPGIFLETCRTCMGSGGIGLGYWDPCPVCGGSGSEPPPTKEEIDEVLGCSDPDNPEDRGRDD